MAMADPSGKEGMNVITEIEDMKSFARTDDPNFNEADFDEGVMKAAKASAATSAAMLTAITLPALGLSGPVLASIYTAAGVGGTSSAVSSVLSGGDASEVVTSASTSATLSMIGGAALGGEGWPFRVRLALAT